MNPCKHVSLSELKSELEKGTPMISISVPKDSSIGEEISLAKTKGYSVWEESVKDPSDLGGIMDTVAVYTFKKSN
jgi:hypothetical protein